MQGIKQIKLWRIIRNLTFVYFEKKNNFFGKLFFYVCVYSRYKKYRELFQNDKKKLSIYHLLTNSKS